MLLEITLAIVFAKMLNLAFEKIKQPGVIGEIIAGIVLGPSLLGALSGVSFNLFGSSVFHFTLDLGSPEFKEVAFIGAIFLLFIVGLQTNTGDLKKVRKAGFFVGITSVFVPFLAGYLLGTLFGMEIIQCMAIGAILNATSTTIAVRIFSDMDMLSTRIGLTLHTAVVINDILAIIIFSLVFGTGNSFTLLFQILIFFAVTITIGFLLVRYAVHKNANRKAPIIILTSGLVICFLFAAVAENMGLTALIGAFIAGLFIRKTPQANILSDYMKTIGYSFFIPLFFVSVGASFDLLFFMTSSNLGFLLFFIIIFVIFGIIANFFGGSLGARISGLSRRESISIGFGMMPVMGVALISVTTGIDRGIFGASTSVLANQIRTATLLLIITSALITPPLLKKSMASPIGKIVGKTKTKLSLYNHPHCHECFSPLRLNADNNEWFCDTCQSFIDVYKKPSKQTFHEKETTDNHIKYIIGAGTILLCGYMIQNSVTMTLFEKVTALIGIFFGTTIAFFTIRLLFSNQKTSGRIF